MAVLNVFKFHGRSDDLDTKSQSCDKRVALWKCLQVYEKLFWSEMLGTTVRFVAS